IGVIFDHSGSMADKLGKAKEAAIQFFKTANPQDEFFLVGFNERAELLSPFTDSVEDLQGRIFSVPAKGRTALLDAIYLGLSEMKGAHHANGRFSSFPTEATTAAGTTKKISSAWFEKRTRSSIPSESSTH